MKNQYLLKNRLLENIALHLIHWMVITFFFNIILDLYIYIYLPYLGSSNIDCNVSTGTIFGVWEKRGSDPAVVEDILRPGHEMISAGYCAYGSATELVLVYGPGPIQRFTLDPSLGEFILTADDLKLPEDSKKIYSINDGNYTTWDSNMQKAIDSFKFSKPAYSARYYHYHYFTT
jgi:fructose-1,6-bisphosphatase I